MGANGRGYAKREVEAVRRGVLHSGQALPKAALLAAFGNAVLGAVFSAFQVNR
jgi:hypothetical protein